MCVSANVGPCDPLREGPQVDGGCGPQHLPSFWFLLGGGRGGSVDHSAYPGRATSASGACPPPRQKPRSTLGSGDFIPRGGGALLVPGQQGPEDPGLMDGVVKHDPSRLIIEDHLRHYRHPG